MTEEKVAKVVESKAEMFRKAAELLEGAPQYQELLRIEADRIDKRNARSRTHETPVQKESRKMAKEVVAWFKNGAEDGVAYEGDEVQTAVGLNVTPQKLSAIMRLVENAEKVPKSDSNKERVGYKKVVNDKTV